MRKCPECGASYEVLDAICPRCGAELPAPYETWSEDDDQADDGYDGGDFPNTVPSTEEQGVVRGTMADGSVWQLAGQYTFAPSQITMLSGAEVLLGDTSLNPGTVVMANGMIIAVHDNAVPDPKDGSTFIDLTGKILAPGFIDIHTHGMMGIDTNAASVDDFQRWSMEAAKRGTTALVPTTTACEPAELSRVLANLHAVREGGVQGARLLGLHMESNFISHEYKGAQPAANIFSPDDPSAWQIRQLIDEYAKDIRIVTVAPEVPGVLDFISWLRERNIVASLGHSAATYEQAVEGIDAGATHATHLFNAMTPLHHREPGLVGAALECDDVFVEMICDGFHVHPAVISTVVTAKGAERVMAITDSLQGAGVESGEFTLGGQRVTVQGGVARLDDGTIAGSITTMDAILRLLVGNVGWDLGEASMLVATTPARGLGIEQLGRITPGAAADLVVLDQGLEVDMTLVNGQIVYQRQYA